MKGGKDEKVNGQGGKRGARAPHGKEISKKDIVDVRHQESGSKYCGSEQLCYNNKTILRVHVRIEHKFNNSEL